jgi:hypothetical protein
MEYYYIIIFIGTFLLGLKLKCNSKCRICKCCDCDIQLEKIENDDGSVLREIKIVKKQKSIIN